MLIYLIGYMGSGKSTVGKKLAGKINFDFIDLDELIEQEYKITINDIFNKFDENAFRLLEHKVLLKTIRLKNTVVSTGGGTPCFFDNMKIMNEHGITVYLRMHPNSIYYRLINSKKKRPLLKSKSETEIKDFIESQLNQREPFYREAHLKIKGENINIEELVSLIMNSKKSGK